MTEIDLIRVPDVDRVWRMIGERVSAALDKTEMEISAGDIWAQCRSGQWLLLIASNEDPQIVGVTVWRFAANQFFDCVLLTGEAMSTWAPALISEAVKIARETGCKGMSATGRPGLIREIQKSLPRTKIVRHTFASEF